MRLAVVIPAHNEEKNIREVILGVKKYANNIIIVDDGSKDNTYLIAKETANDILVLRHKINLGKGAALKTGCDYALSKGVQKIIAMDADGQHEPKEIPVFLAALDQQEIIFGCRKVPKTMPLVFRLGNKVISKSQVG